MSAPHQDSGSDTELPRELSEILEFLYGAAPLDGVWFGGKPEGMPRYWWRSKLRDAIKAAFANRRPSPAAPAAEDALLDAFGRPRVRYVRVIHDGTTCVVPPGDVADLVDSERPDDYRTENVYLSKEEFDALPEFDGF